MGLGEAISAVQAAQTTLTEASGAQAQAQAAFDAAQLAKAQADAASQTATSGFNGALDDLITAAQAAKIGQTAEPMVATAGA